MKITDQDAAIRLKENEVTKLTYDGFKNQAFSKIEKGISTLEFSESGYAVLEVNKALHLLGYSISEKQVSFSQNTQNALIAFQISQRITPNGVFDMITLFKMDQALNALQEGEDGGLTIPERAQMLYEGFTHRTFYLLWGTDEDKIFSALEKLSSDDRIRLIAYYDKEYSSKRKKGLVKELYDELGDRDLYKAINLLYADYEEPQTEQPQEQQQSESTTTTEMADLELKTIDLAPVIVNALHPWIKSKTKYTIEGSKIEFDCVFDYPTGSFRSLDEKLVLPRVVRKVLVQKNNRVYDLFATPYFRAANSAYQDGRVINSFSIGAYDPGVYTFMFIIEDTEKKAFSAYTTTHQVKTLADAATEELSSNETQNYNDFRQQVAFVEQNLSKSADNDQKTDPNFYIKLVNNTKNPERVVSEIGSYAPQLYYSLQGKINTKDNHYFWFAEITTPKEMSSDASALLGSNYGKNAVVRGYQRGEYYGKDGWNMNSSQSAATFLGTMSGIFVIHCIELDKDNKPTERYASFRQVVLPSEDYEALQKFQKYKADIDTSYNTIKPGTAVEVNAIAIETKTTKTITLNLFLGKSKNNPGNYVLSDLTPGAEHKRTYEGKNIKELFESFDSKNTYPDGMLAYEIPANDFGYPTLKGNFTTNGASFWETVSSGAGWASLGLAVAGIVASFTPAAPIAPFLFVASGATGATSGAASIVDKMEKGTLTSETLALDTIMIASSFLAIGGAMSRVVYKGLPIVKISATGLRYIVITDFALNGTAGIMITVDGLESIKAINANDQLTTAEKIDATVKIVAQLTLTTGLLVLSSKNLKGAEVEQLPVEKKKTVTTKQKFNPEQHAEFIDTPENLPRGKAPKPTETKINQTETPKNKKVTSKPQIEVIPTKKYPTEAELLNFEKALDSADPKVRAEINKMGKEEFDNLKKGYKDNPKAFTEALKSYDSFFGDNGWHKFWKNTPDIINSLDDIDKLKRENKLLPTGDATDIELASVHAFTVDGGFINTPARFMPSWWGEYNSAVYKDLKSALDKLRKVKERNMYGKIVFSGRTETLEYFESTLKNGKGTEVAFTGMVSGSLDREVAEGFIQLSAKNAGKGKTAGTAETVGKAEVVEKVAIIRKIETAEGVYIDDLSDWGKNFGKTRHFNADPPSTMIQEEVLMNEGYFRQMTEPKYTKTVNGVKHYEIGYKELVKPLK
ncbi:peptidoglycan-binding domain-containing protein [Flavobacterium sp.]|uniref:peptidoglycan-binding domain-containing protein n=1 Tax=Flavobacterium sp. TaxID=239 RepID=UPI002630646D|nr:peptidoglycan-binding domain-containing protein [Flavobacterium sp.]